MAKALKARILGDDYQAHIFWMAACRMLIGDDGIKSVEIESSDVKSLDDVVVHYEQGHRDSEGLLRETDYYQVKYHVDYRGSMGFKTLCNPDFINASSYSFLQRAYDAWKKFGRESLRIFLYNIWGIDGTDALGELVSANDGRILVEKWRDCTSRSKFGKVRECWRKHLKCSVAEFEMFLLSLRLVQGGSLNLSVYGWTVCCDWLDLRCFPRLIH